MHNCPECGRPCACESGNDILENCGHYMTPECTQHSGEGRVEEDLH